VSGIYKLLNIYKSSILYRLRRGKWSSCRGEGDFRNFPNFTRDLIHFMSFLFIKEP